MNHETNRIFSSSTFEQVEDVPIPGAIIPMDDKTHTGKAVASAISNNPFQETHQASRNESATASSSTLMVKTAQNFLRSSFSRQRSITPRNGKRHQVAKRQNLEDDCDGSKSHNFKERSDLEDDDSSQKEHLKNIPKSAQRRATSHDPNWKDGDHSNWNNQSCNHSKVRGNSCPGASSSTTDFKNQIDTPIFSDQIPFLNRTRLHKSTFEESRTSSESFRSRVFGRMGSAVGKRSKSIEDPLSSISPEEVISGKALKKQNSHLESKNASTAFATSNSSFCPSFLGFNVAVEGWLYKRKRMTWTKQWTVLSSNKTLSFYSSKEDSKQSRPSTVVDFQHGCKVGNVVQTKVNNSFTLTPNIATGDLQRLRNQKVVGLNSKSTGKRLELMSKNSQEFVRWIECFTALNFNSNLQVKPTIEFQQTMSAPKSIQKGTEEMAAKSTLSLEPSNNVLSTKLQSNHKVYTDLDSCEKNSNAEHVDTLQMHSFKDADAQTSSSVSAPDIKKQSSESQDGSNQFEEKRASPENSKSIDKVKSLLTDQEIAKQNMNSWNILWVDSETDEEAISNGEKHQSSPLLLKNEIATQNKQDELNKSTLADSTPSSSSESVCEEKIFKAKSTPSLDFEADLERRYSLSDIATNELGKSDPIAASYSDIMPDEVTRPDLTAVATTSQSKITSNHKPLSDSDNLCKCLDDCVTSPQCLKNGDKKEIGKLNENSIDGNRMPNFLSSNSDLHRRELSNVIGSISLPFSLKPRLQNSTSHSDTTTKGPSISTITCDKIPEATENSDREENSLNVLDRIKHFERLASSFKQLKKTDVNDDHFTEPQSSTINRESISLTGKTKLTEGVSHYPKHRDEGTPYSITDHEDNFIGVTDALSTKGNSELSVSNEEVLNLSISFKHCELKRSHSDSILFEPTDGNRYGMRTIKQPIPILTYIDFVETYGRTTSRYNTPGNFKTSISMPSNLNLLKYEKRKHSIGSDANFSPQKSCTEESSSSDSLPSLKYGSLLEKEINDLSSNKSSGSGTSDSSSTKENLKNWWSSVSPSKIRKSLRKSSDCKTSFKAQTFEIPASSLTYASHSGYLDMRTKRKQWERFWCVFQDSCLYCYNSPQSDVTRDAHLLRSYKVIADVKNMNRTRFEFQIKQQGATAFHFSTDNHQEFLLWVGTFERESKTVLNDARRIEENKSETAKVDSSLSSFSEGESNERSPTLQRSSLQQCLEQEMIEEQKHQLLKEIATQQQQLLLENRMLDSITCSTSASPSPHIQLRRESRRIEVLEKFDRQREEEEMNATKLMALLNRRRNSAQLKVDQLARDMAPKTGKKRRQNHQEYAALEAKLNEMKEKLLHVDKEIQNLQANKQNTIDKIRERQDLELFFTEQQAALSVLRHQESESFQNSVAKRRQHSSSQSGLASIDEQNICSAVELRKSISECALDSKTDYPLQRSFRSKSSYPHVFEDEYEEASSSVSTSSSSKSQGFLPLISRASETEQSAFQLLKSSSKADDTLLKRHEIKKKEVDPSVLAGIEEFEIFSKQMLKKMQKK